MTTSYDAIVLGCGGMGSATLFELARRGRRVLGLEQFPLVHDRGSSHGHTRVIRTAYYEHPDYVPLLKRAWERWYDLEQLTGRHLLTECGCLSIGPSDGELVCGVKAAVATHGLRIENRDEPAFRVPAGCETVFETQAGFLMVEECVRAYLDAATASGAEVHAEETVLGWQSDGNGIAVRTTRGTYYTAKLVVTAGAWATKLLADIGIPFSVMRQVMLWFQPGDLQLFRRDRFPVFLFETPLGPFYGLPMIDARGVKVARHYGAPELASPDDVKWDTTDADEQPVWEFLNQFVTSPFTRCTGRQVCQYTLTPDRHFVLDVHPANPNVILAAGFSGHGFKFAAVVGEILADLAEQGRTRHPIDLFRAGRFKKKLATDEHG
ncbi:N-methyl-L-tryptophan oxidase [Limnoglobus roseus]|uniref:N-methyl-L-tryptophan oxidase n=1 Tax=Limnoglobus roseus TaxID=2598579 RepID=A0A5C1A7V4_9BACT|nr:N-methyl-L-tryptophan oxidase [Limnoglobus roseus]QEL13194.1 N-methyl-L-tryptophan oxidase [Limnoglobus roseus]